MEPTWSLIVNQIRKISAVDAARSPQSSVARHQRNPVHLAIQKTLTYVCCPIILPVIPWRPDPPGRSFGLTTYRSVIVMQSTNPQYPNPPLREAVCEFRFQPGPDQWDLSFPGLIYNELRHEFPRRIQDATPQQVFSITFGTPPENMGGFNAVDPAQSLRFWRDNSQDGVITVGPNRIGVSHYRPYPSWDNFLDVVKQAFDSYLTVVRPQTIQRIGLRYINEVAFDFNSVNLSEYFTFHPNFGPKLPQSNVNVRMSVDFTFDEHRDLARLQLGTIPGSDHISIAISLDIDYFLLVPGTVPLTGIELWLDRAHSRISSIFEGSITDKTRSLFK